MALFQDNFRKGFTLVELIVVMAIFVIVVASFFGAARVAFRAIDRSNEQVQAAYLLEEGMEAVRYMRDFSFQKFIAKEQLGYEECLYFDDVKKMFATSSPEIVSQWHLDEVAGPTVSDVSGSQNNGTQVNGVAFGSPGVNVNSIINYQTSVTFNGATNNRYIITSKLPSTLNIASDMSIEAWVKPNASAVVGSLVISSSEWNGCEICGIGGLDLVANVPRFNVPATGSSMLNTYSVSAPQAISAGTWHHIVGTYIQSAKKANLYVDGKLVASGSHGGTGPLGWNKSFKLGTYLQSTGPSNVLDGSLDEVTIYSRALSANEVIDRYNGHAICKLSSYPSDDTKQFTRTVTFWNVCRKDAGADRSNITGITVASSGTANCPAGSSVQETDTKKAVVKVFWGNQRQYIQSIEEYVINLFVDTTL